MSFVLTEQLADGKLQEEFETKGVPDDVPEYLRKHDNEERMEAAAAAYKIKALRLLGTQDPTQIQKTVLRRVVVTQEERFYGCLSLPFSLAFFLLFALSTQLHEDITNVYLLHNGLQGQLNNGIPYVDSISDVWKFLNESLFPSMLNQNGADKSQWGRVLSYNQVVGPIVLQQRRSPKQLCKASGNYGAGSVGGDMWCFPWSDSDTGVFGANSTPAIATPVDGEYAGGNASLAERAEFYMSAFSPAVATSLKGLLKKGTKKGRILRTPRTEYASSLATSGSSYNAYFYPNTPTKLILEQIGFLKQRGWLDEQTKSVQVKGLFLNAEYGRPRLVMFSNTITMHRGGGVFVGQGLETIFLLLWEGRTSQLVDALWIVSWMAIVASHLKDTFKAYKEENLVKFLCSGWSLLQFAISFLGFLVVAGYGVQNVLRGAVATTYQSTIISQLQDIPADQNTVGQELNDLSNTYVSFNKIFRLLIGQYHLVLMARFFSAFSAQPRLGVVTRTLEISIIDILHFLVVCLPTLMAYAISANLFFGRRVEYFSTIDAAISNCYSIIVQAQYLYDDFQAESWWIGNIWVWTFMFVMNMLMLNMVLAIILDVYTELKSGNNETVFVTLRHMSEQLLHKAEWIPNTKLLSMIEELPDVFTKEELQRRCVGMKEVQLHQLLEKCKEEAENSRMTEFPATESNKMAMAIKLVMDKVTGSLTELHQGTGIAKGWELVPGSSWVQGLRQEMAVQNQQMLTIQWQLQQLEWQWQAASNLHGKTMHPSHKFELRPEAEQQQDSL